MSERRPRDMRRGGGCEGASGSLTEMVNNGDGVGVLECTTDKWSLTQCAAFVHEELFSGTESADITNAAILEQRSHEAYFTRQTHHAVCLCRGG